MHLTLNLFLFGGGWGGSRDFDQLKHKEEELYKSLGLWVPKKFTQVEGASGDLLLGTG